MGVSVSTRVSRLGNYYAGAWHDPAAGEFLPVIDPATDNVLAEVPLTSPAEATAINKPAANAIEICFFIARISFCLYPWEDTYSLGKTHGPLATFH